MAERINIEMSVETFGLMQALLVEKIKESSRGLVMGQALGVLPEQAAKEAAREIELITSLLLSVPNGKAAFAELQANPETVVAFSCPASPADNPAYVKARADFELKHGKPSGEA